MELKEYMEELAMEIKREQEELRSKPLGKTASSKKCLCNGETVQLLCVTGGGLATDKDGRDFVHGRSYGYKKFCRSCGVKL